MAGQHMKRVSMELGGHAPVIVCEDADLELAVKTLGGAKFRNAGQVCISPTRFLVHRSVAKDFGAALAKVADGLTVGDGLAEGTQMGPLANTRRLDAMRVLGEDAVQRGATVLAGGRRLGDTGNFWAPTVYENVSADARLFNEEPFGPVAGIREFDHLNDAITEANRLSFGLAGYALVDNARRQPRSAWTQPAAVTEQQDRPLQPGPGDPLPGIVDAYHNVADATASSTSPETTSLRLVTPRCRTRVADVAPMRSTSRTRWWLRRSRTGDLPSFPICVSLPGQSRRAEFARWARIKRGAPPLPVRVGTTSGNSLGLTCPALVRRPRRSPTVALSTAFRRACRVGQLSLPSSSAFAVRHAHRGVPAGGFSRKNHAISPGHGIRPMAIISLVT
jgi:hypothetical protein